MSAIKVSAFRWVPPFAQGLVRDLRVRWALEEAGLPYEERLLSMGDNKSESYRRLQPFGQVPTYEEGGLCSSNQGPSCSMSPNDRRRSCRPILRRARGRRVGCSPR